MGGLGGSTPKPKESAAALEGSAAPNGSIEKGEDGEEATGG